MEQHTLEERNARIVEMIHEGMTTVEVGAEFDISGERVSQIYEQRTGERPTEHRTRVMRHKRMEAYELKETGATYGEVSQMLGVNKHTIRDRVRKHRRSMTQD